MAQNHPKDKTWAVRDICFVEVALTATAQHMHIEFSHGIRVVIADRSQIDLASELIEHLRVTALRGGAK